MSRKLSARSGDVSVATVSIAVIGAGDIGRRHMVAISQETSCVLSAIVDPLSNGPPASQRFQAPLFKDLESMIETVEPDGIIIAAPTALHVPLAEQCIARGVPVLVEKPISDDVASGYALADLAESRAVPILVGHHRRHNPLMQRARDIVESGALGAVAAISATWLVRKPDTYFDVSWRGEPGGGPILINLIHDVDSLRFMAGEIVSVQGACSNQRRGLAVEDTAAAILTFANGAIGAIVISDATPSPWSWELTAGETTSYSYPRIAADCYLIAGSLAAMAVPSLRIWRHNDPQGWQSPLIEEQNKVAEADPLAAQISHFAKVIRGTSKPLVTARDAARTLEVTSAVTQAARTRAAIEIPMRD